MPAIRKSFALASVFTLLLPGCYVLPVAPDATPGPLVTVVPSPPIVLAAPATPVPGTFVGGGASPVTLTARLYPANQAASQHGIVAGTVTNLRTGKGRFILDYEGELLSGEATRVRGDEQRGIANAYGPRGTYMSCDYRMTSPVQGVGTCTLSNGARYTVHLGS